MRYLALHTTVLYNIVGHGTYAMLILSPIFSTVIGVVSIGPSRSILQHKIFSGKISINS